MVIIGSEMVIGRHEQPPTSEKPQTSVRCSPTSHGLTPNSGAPERSSHSRPRVNEPPACHPHPPNRPLSSQTKHYCTLPDALLDPPALPLVRWPSHRGPASAPRWRLRTSEEYANIDAGTGVAKYYLARVQGSPSLRRRDFRPNPCCEWSPTRLSSAYTPYSFII